ncbi:MOSC domain-containing protein [Kiloniella antarctica]|uniref:MOSC domain-containing protein n=1 Tax=Kiloniella antarctica TaxID=1550907 RepID=A0ABW5BKR1_9PROT
MITSNVFLIDKVLTGRAVSFGPKDRMSAIDKVPVFDALQVTKLGLFGDEQADPRHHGGPEKAIHHYAADHYATWGGEFPEINRERLYAGGFGENISTMGLCEADVFIGDVYRIGTALVQVSQGRQPCWKLNVRFENSKMAALVQSTGRTGWYYRVLEEGKIQAGDRISLVERINSEWSLSRIQHVLYEDTLNQSALEALAGIKELAENWRVLVQKRLSRLKVEDWKPRLETPA